MSITDELREWLKSLYTPNSATLKDEGERIADRIDAEHEKAVASVMNDALYHANDENMAELGWIRLPKDADGEPIHIGDVMEWVRYKDDDPTIVRNVSAVGNGVFFAWSDEQGRYAQYEAHAYRHHHAPTVEDVLREFTDAILEWAGKSGTVAEVGTWSDVAAEYAAKLRLAETEDA